MARTTAAIPKSARLARLATATLPDGRAYELAIYAGEASHGYQTDYSRTAHEWLVMRVDGRTYGCWQYSGINVRAKAAHHQYDRALREVVKAGAVVAQSGGIA